MRIRPRLIVLCLIVPVLAGPAVSSKVPVPGGSVLALLPQVAGWKTIEEPKSYGPESLFEYIDGAAEAFINYDFLELGLGQYQKPGSPATMTVEIYDMGSPLNAFGIYSIERYPESRFLAIGTQGYIEEGTLNFLAGRYYVKMMAFETGAQTESVLRSYAEAILKKTGPPGQFPALLKAFPGAGLVANSEKYILKNFLGLEFLKNGTVASYKLEGSEPDAFVVETAAAGDAAALLIKYLDAASAKGKTAENRGGLHHIRDPYLAHVFIGQSGRFLYGATKIKDDALGAGEKLAAGLGAALASR